MTKAEAARANGAKSNGPATPEGKARSAQNSTRHGLNSQTVVLASESQEEYNELLSDFLRRYQPAGPVETDLVHEIAATRWRLRRILRLETAAFDQVIERAIEENPEATESEALENLASSKTLSMLDRYEGRLRRGYERAVAELRRIQSERAAAAETELSELEQNEPKRNVSQAWPVLGATSVREMATSTASAQFHLSSSSD